MNKTNTDAVINKLCICRWFCSKDHLHHAVDNGSVLYILIASSVEQH